MEIESRSDARLVQQSMKWAVTQAQRSKTLELAEKLVDSGDPKLGKIGAEIFLKAEDMNLRHQIHEQKIAQAEQERKRQLIEYAVKLGIVKPVDNRLGVIDSEPSEG